MPGGLGINAAAQDCLAEGTPRPRRPASSRGAALAPASALQSGSRGGMLMIGPSNCQPGAAAGPACARLAAFDRVGMCMSACQPQALFSSHAGPASARRRAGSSE
jgi:hypothetical protein